MRRFLPAVVALCALAVPAVAHAVAPKTATFDIAPDPAHPNIVSVCPFPVGVTSALHFTERDFFDASGAQIRSEFTVTETDFFTGPTGKTLSGLPYRSAFHATLDPTDPTHRTQFAAITTGVIARVPLPDGSTFLSAGRFDFIAQDSSFTLVPATGVSGNVAGFCAALAP